MAWICEPKSMFPKRFGKDWAEYERELVLIALEARSQQLQREWLKQHKLRVGKPKKRRSKQ